jgi:hypothetical protein
MLIVAVFCREPTFCMCLFLYKKKTPPKAEENINNWSDIIGQIIRSEKKKKTKKTRRK